MDEVQRMIKRCIDNYDTSLNLNGMSLFELPSNLPTFLEYLYCSYNNLKELPPNLPDSLKELYCMHNKISKLPTKLPSSLEVLHCNNDSMQNCTKVCFSRPISLPISQDILQECRCYDNKYLYISKNIAKRFNKKETPNYNQKAIIIQHKWRATKYKQIMVKMIMDNDNTLSNSFKSYGDLNIVHLIANYVF